MDFSKPEDFYDVYDRHRTYVRAEVRKKHIAEFDRNLWNPREFRTKHRVLELGCGVGLFLAFLQSKGIFDFHGVEMDQKAREYMPASISDHVTSEPFSAFFDQYDGPAWDRIVLLDVFEHFSPKKGVELLRRCMNILSHDGQIILRVPNVGSPWGLQYQFNDLTHKAFYAPGNIRQIGMALGLNCIGCIPYTRGSSVRRITNAIIEGIFNSLLTDPPPNLVRKFRSIFWKS